MASLQDIRRRIHSVKNTSKITKAMELVAGAKLRRAQVRIESLRPFANGMHELISETASRTGSLSGQPLLERREIAKTAILLMSGDRGLAGAFNASVLRRALDEAAVERAAGREIVWYAAGRKGAGSLRFRGAELREVWTGFTDRPVYQDAEQISHALIEHYGAGTPIADAAGVRDIVDSMAVGAVGGDLAGGAGSLRRRDPDQAMKALGAAKTVEEMTAAANDLAMAPLSPEQEKNRATPPWKSFQR